MAPTPVSACAVVTGRRVHTCAVERRPRATSTRRIVLVTARQSRASADDRTPRRETPRGVRRPEEPPRIVDELATKRRVRVPRAHTYYSSAWPWKRTPPRSRWPWNSGRGHRGGRSPRGYATDDDDDGSGPDVVRVLEAFWQRSVRGVTESPFVAAVAELGVLFIRRVSDALERTLWSDAEAELIEYEYGVTRPSPGDKTYVDPLRDWEISNVTYYYDSFGRKVYPQLQTGGTRVRIFAREFRDIADDHDADTDAERTSPQQRPIQDVTPQWQASEPDLTKHPRHEPDSKSARPKT